MLRAALSAPTKFIAELKRSAKIMKPTGSDKKFVEAYRDPQKRNALLSDLLVQRLFASIAIFVTALTLAFDHFFFSGKIFSLSAMPPIIAITFITTAIFRSDADSQIKLLLTKE